MKLEVILKITDEYRYKMAKNSKETMCVLISSAVRCGDLENLSELLESKEQAVVAIEAYRTKNNKQEHSAPAMDEVA